MINKCTLYAKTYQNIVFCQYSNNHSFHFVGRSNRNFQCCIYGCLETSQDVPTNCLDIFSFSCIFTARKRSLRRLCFYTCLSVILLTGGGGHAWLGVCVAGGAYMARGHAWRGVACVPKGACVPRGMHAQGGCACPGVMHVCRACMHPGPPPNQPDTTTYGRLMSGRYASYWNAFLFKIKRK